MPEQKKYSCLIIEDEENIQKLIGDLIDRTNLFKMVFHSYDGIDAGLKISNQDFDLVIVDKNIPKRDGISLLKNEILSGRLNPKKTILISGLLQEEDIVKVKELNLQHILVKPFKANDFNNKILQILKLNNN